MKKVVVINDTRLEMHHGCSRVMNNLDYLIKKNNGEVIASWPVGKDWRLSEEIKKDIIKSDLVIINGEGSIHHDSKTGTKLLFVADFCKQYEVPCYLINCLFQEISPKFGKLLKNFKMVSVRDSFSQKEIERYGISAPMVPDLTFYTPSIRNNDRSTTVGFTCSMSPEKTVMIYKQFSKLEYESSYLPMLYQTNIWDGDAEVESKLEKLRRMGFNTFLTKAIERVKITPSFRKIPKHSEYKCHNEYFKVISELDSLITGRFHAACFAINSLTPFSVYKSNSHKIEALIHDVGLDSSRIIESGDFSKPSPFSEIEMSNIESFLEKSRENMEELFIEIFNCE
ncbi:hypothetical protein A148_12230 [Vibrio splendidus 1F-157]|uniref:polysaccharide pyruvyl transferase family protein n=1 Tax=Vibrio splendidus TaxID=29497 RepID=UPI000316B88D|nr:polysaccharide pyruvyl transferase family protein [Vibrio splendidus]OEF79689.1 hypothetical protein A148_12230 [Vibrio splendidus 1F-157]